MANEQLEQFLAGETATVTRSRKRPPQAGARARARPRARGKGRAGRQGRHGQAGDRGRDRSAGALEGEPVIPRRAYEDERRKRQDWKARAVEAETKHKELQRQFEDAQRRATAPPPQQQAPPQPPPDPGH